MRSIVIGLAAAAIATAASTFSASAFHGGFGGGGFGRPALGGGGFGRGGFGRPHLAVAASAVAASLGLPLAAASAVASLGAALVKPHSHAPAASWEPVRLHSAATDLPSITAPSGVGLPSVTRSSGVGLPPIVPSSGIDLPSEDLLSIARSSRRTAFTGPLTRTATAPAIAACGPRGDGVSDGRANELEHKRLLSWALRDRRPGEPPPRIGI